MTGHMRLTSVDPSRIPTTFSKAVISGLLRDKLGFAGVALTDDLDMAAISEVADRREAVIRAIDAGNDLLMIGNTSDYDPQLPQHVVEWVEDAIDVGALSVGHIASAANRVRKIKRAYA